MSEQYSTRRLVRPLENWLAHVVLFARERKRWWEKTSGSDKELTRDMPAPRPRGPPRQESSGFKVSSKDKNKKSKSSGDSKKGGKKDTESKTSNSKKDAGAERKGPDSYSKS